MTFQEVLDHFGTKRKIATDLGITIQAVQQWADSGKVPLGRQFQIELVTKGKLQAPKEAAA